MNILITTFSLLLVLSFSASFFWKEAKGSAETLRAARGFFEAARTTQNKYEQKRFQHFRTQQADTPSKEKKSSRHSSKIFVSHRLTSPPLEQGRVHIAPLRQKEYTPILQPLFKHLLQELYGHASWYDVLKIDRLIAAYVEPNEEFSLDDFVKKLDPDLYALWYRMMKGTHLYDTEQHIGYPPLEDFIDFSPSTAKHLCHFPFAPLPVLRAFFGKDLTKQILELENAKWEKDRRRRYCTKKELFSLISRNSRNAEYLNTIETFCYFNQSIGKRTFVQGAEERSKIALRRTIKDDEPATK